MGSHISREKKYVIVYLLIFYCLITIIFLKALYVNFRMPNMLNFQIATVENKPLQEMEKYVAISDSINKLVTTYNLDSEKMFHESSLNYEFEELRRGYNSNAMNDEYKILHQLDDFYSNLFFDKKATSNSLKSTEFLKKNLDECEIGFKQTQNSIQLQEALKSIKQ